MFKSRHRSCGYVTLRYIRKSGEDSQEVMAIIWAKHNVFTPPQFYLWKSAVSECIQYLSWI